MTTFKEYENDALRTANSDFETLSKSFAQNPRNIAIANWAMGLAGEAGEACDYLKKCLFHGHPMDKDKVAKEIGDVLWYAAVLAHEVGVPFEEIAQRNIAKLRARYPDHFTSADSIARRDTTEEPRSYGSH